MQNMQIIKCLTVCSANIIVDIIFAKQEEYWTLCPRGHTFALPRCRLELNRKSLSARCLYNNLKFDTSLFTFLLSSNRKLCANKMIAYSSVVESLLTNSLNLTLLYVTVFLKALTDQTDQPICMFSCSNDAVWAKNVPLEDDVYMSLHLEVENPLKSSLLFPEFPSRLVSTWLLNSRSQRTIRTDHLQKAVGKWNGDFLAVDFECLPLRKVINS
jgi:hypothetical protein